MTDLDTDVEKLAKWLEFQFEGPQISNQIKALVARAQTEQVGLTDDERRALGNAVKFRIPVLQNIARFTVTPANAADAQEQIDILVSAATKLALT